MAWKKPINWITGCLPTLYQFNEFVLFHSTPIWTPPQNKFAPKQIQKAFSKTSKIQPSTNPLAFFKRNNQKSSRDIFLFRVAASPESLPKKQIIVHLPHPSLPWSPLKTRCLHVWWAEHGFGSSKRTQHLKNSWAKKTGICWFEDFPADPYYSGTP